MIGKYWRGISERAGSQNQVWLIVTSCTVKQLFYLFTFLFRIGRKKTLIIGVIFWSIGFTVTTFSVNIYMYTAFRFIAAFGNIGVYISVFVLGKLQKQRQTLQAGLDLLGPRNYCTDALYQPRDRRLLKIVDVFVLGELIVMSVYVNFGKQQLFVSRGLFGQCSKYIIP